MQATELWVMVGCMKQTFSIANVCVTNWKNAGRLRRRDTKRQEFIKILKNEEKYFRMEPEPKTSMQIELNHFILDPPHL